jgi:PAT family beta-lactamase induction signal transducer AmpG
MGSSPASWGALGAAMRSWRTASVSLLSFSSGLPLGLVWITIPTWMAREGADIKYIGLFTIAQAPWTFKFVWSPLMDRYSPPMPRVGPKIAWTLVTQAFLLLLTFGLAGIRYQPDVVWIIGALTMAMAFASASQDIAIDAYAVEVLRPEEQGVAVGARIAIYRSAMFVAGGVAITLGGLWSWPFIFALLGLLYVPMMAVSWFAPHSAYGRAQAPLSLRAAVWEPFVGFLSVERSLQILAFVVLYKLADNLAGALIRPFLVQVGFNDFDVGIATATIGLFATLAGTFLGGMLTTAWGLGHSLWIFGALQILSNFGYVLVAQVGVDRPLMYGAMGFEALTTGMGTGAFSVLLLRMTQKRFSATQYALFSSLFALPRILSGPVTGVMVDAVGWRDYFLFTMIVGIPGMVMLQKFSPLGTREPRISEEAGRVHRPIGKGGLVLRAAFGTVAAFGCGVTATALLGAFKSLHAAPEAGFDLVGPLLAIFNPQSISAWSQLVGNLLFGAIIGLATAATYAARRGSREW